MGIIASKNNRKFGVTNWIGLKISGEKIGVKIPNENKNHVPKKPRKTKCKNMLSFIIKCPR